MEFNIKNLKITIPENEIEYFRKRQNRVPCEAEIVEFLIVGQKKFNESDPVKAVILGLHDDLDDYEPIF